VTRSFGNLNPGWECLKTVTDPADSSPVSNVPGESSGPRQPGSEAQLVRCLEEYPDVAIIVGPDGAIMWGNRAA